MPHEKKNMKEKNYHLKKRKKEKTQTIEKNKNIWKYWGKGGSF